MLKSDHRRRGAVRRAKGLVGAATDVSSESRMREIRPSGSMRGTWRRSMDRLVRHRQTKGPGTDRPLLNHRATSLLYSGVTCKWASLQRLGLPTGAGGAGHAISVPAGLAS